MNQHHLEDRMTCKLFLIYLQETTVCCSSASVPQIDTGAVMQTTCETAMSIS